MMNTNFFVVFFLLISTNISFSQKEVTWQDLSQVEFNEKYLPEYEASFLYPTFADSIIEMEGEEITITGYFLDIDPEGKLFVLSQGPMSSCFFCGVGGPETAIELYFKSKPDFKMDDLVTVTGTLKLNWDDVNHFYYILKRSKGKKAASGLEK